MLLKLEERYIGIDRDEEWSWKLICNVRGCLCLEKHDTPGLAVWWNMVRKGGRQIRETE